MFINKKDKILIISLLLISLFSILILNLNQKQSNIAYVYHDNKLLKKVDLNINKTYTFDGDKGKVIVTVKDKKIKVDKETSEYHLCSKMGYISRPHETIICLPNKIVIEIGGNEVDTVVR